MTKATHRYDAVILACIDDAIYEFLNQFFRKELKLHCDEVKLAGGAKNLIERGPRREAALEDIALSIDKHKVGTIILVNHENCGKLWR